MSGLSTDVDFDPPNLPNSSSRGAHSGYKSVRISGAFALRLPSGGYTHKEVGGGALRRAYNLQRGSPPFLVLLAAFQRPPFHNMWAFLYSSSAMKYLVLLSVGLHTQCRM